MSIFASKFNNERYGDYQAMPSESNFFSDKVYLYKIFRELNRIFAVRQSKRVLEIGCADGSFSVYLHNRGYDIEAIDIADDAVGRAVSLGINAKVCDIEQGLNFQDENFDAVVACEVIEHLYDTDYFIKEIRRVVKSGGYVFLSTPNLASLKNRLRLLFGKYPQYSEYNLGANSAGHIRNYTVETLVSQLRSAGFDVVKITSPNLLCPMTRQVPFFIKKIAMHLGDIFYNLGSHIIVVAKK